MVHPLSRGCETSRQVTCRSSPEECLPQENEAGRYEGQSCSWPGRSDAGTIASLFWQFFFQQNMFFFQASNCLDPIFDPLGGVQPMQPVQPKKQLDLMKIMSEATTGEKNH